MSSLAINEIHTLAADTPPVIKDLDGNREMVQGCWAWVNFNGTGTIAINADFNVASLTDNGTGDYDVNLTNALPSLNAACVAGGTSNAKGGGLPATYSCSARVDTASVIKLSTGYVSTVGVPFDFADISVAVFVNP